MDIFDNYDTGPKFIPPTIQETIDFIKQNEDKYMEIYESKFVNGVVSESSNYFLKLKRESLNISIDRAKELEEIVKQNRK